MPWHESNNNIQGNIIYRERTVVLVLNYIYSSNNSIGILFTLGHGYVMEDMLVHDS
jgi:hypothetical protein